MSIFIQFVQDNLALFVCAIVAVVVLIGSVVALVVVKGKLKRAERASVSAGKAPTAQKTGGAGKAPTAQKTAAAPKASPAVKTTSAPKKSPAKTK